MYLRFAVPDPRSHALAPHGVFRAAYALKRSAELEPHHRERLDELLHFFETKPPVPRDRRVGGGAIFWLKDRPTPVARRMWELATALRLCDRQVHVAKTTWPGRIDYEDEHQVAAAPQARTFRELAAQQPVVLRSLRAAC